MIVRSAVAKQTDSTTKRQGSKSYLVRFFERGKRRFLQITGRNGSQERRAEGQAGADQRQDNGGL